MLDALALVIVVIGAVVLGVYWLWVHGLLRRGLPGYRPKDHDAIVRAGNVGRSRRRKRA